MAAVSVVVPMFQGAKWITSTLESVKAQTLAPSEIIVVDDGSSDGGHLLVEECLANSNIPLRLKRTPNRGVSAARNLGMALAEGDYVALLDADDLWLPAKLASQLTFLQAHDAVACTTEYVRMLEDGRSLSVPPFSWAPGDLIDWLHLRRTGPALASTLLIERKAVTAIGGFLESLSNAADLEFAFRLASRGEVGLVPQNLMSYRIHEHQMHQVSSNLLDEHLFIAKAALVRADLIKQCERELRTHLALARFRSQPNLGSLRNALREAILNPHAVGRRVRRGLRTPR